MSRALAAAFLLTSVPALAFEGVIDTKMTATGGEAGGKPMSFAGAGTISIILNDSNKTYQKLADDKKEAPDEGKGWTVKKIGKETVAGRPTEHVQVLHEGKDPMDVWIDTALVSAGDLEKAFAAGDRRQGGWWQALKKAGVAGIPLKVVAKNERGGGMTWEAMSVKSQTVPDSAFKIPSGYTETKSGAGIGSSLTPEQQQQMREQMMQRLTPEQRQQMEEMMKQRQGGGQQ